jgi:glutathione S-transferase
VIAFLSKTKIIEKQMKNLTILGKTTSINVRKVLWTCAEIGLDYQLIEYGSGTARALDTPDFLQLNPNAMVPVLLTDEGHLWESNSICRYLATRYQRDDLLPNTAMARAQVEKWMDWQATELNNAWRYAFMGLVRQHPHFQDPVAIAHSVQQWNRAMGLLEAQLQVTGAYVQGRALSLADIGIGLSLHRWLASPIEHAEYPALQSYYALLKRTSQFAPFALMDVA